MIEITDTVVTYVRQGIVSSTIYILAHGMIMRIGLVVLAVKFTDWLDHVISSLRMIVEVI